MEIVGNHFVVDCGYCGEKNRELIDPENNPHPFMMLQERCRACGRPIDVDWELIDKTFDDLLVRKITRGE